MLNYKAGATRHELVLDGTSLYQVVCKRGDVRVVREPGRTTVRIVDGSNGSSKSVCVGLIKGYDFRHVHGPEPLIFQLSSAACESGLLYVLQVGTIIEQIGYKGRRASLFYIATECGLVSCNNPNVIEKCV